MLCSVQSRHNHHILNTVMNTMAVTCDKPTLSDLPPEVLESIFLLLGPRPVTWLAGMEDISLTFQAATAKVSSIFQSCAAYPANFSFLSYLGTVILL